ncbi:MAG TPA: DUF4157 domain-containing protein, partial [Kofleriaceae bacterium]|nr:DUF4157 domain-containing protein [Kofleriaceae bacterium]
MLDRLTRDIDGAEQALGEALVERRRPRAGAPMAEAEERLRTRLRIARWIGERAALSVRAIAATDGGEREAAHARLELLQERLRGLNAEAGKKGPSAAAAKRGELPYRQQMETAFKQDFSNVRVTLGAAAEMDAIGAHAVTSGEHVTFASEAPGQELVAHELAHVVQQRRGGGAGAQASSVGAGERDHLENEADVIAARVARGGAAGEIRGATAGTGLRKDKGGGAAAPDLGGAPYEWVSGTMKVRIRAAWFRSAHDFEEKGSQWQSPSRIRELLTHLREKGMLSWVSDAVIARAAEELDIDAIKGDVGSINLQAPVFHSIGLPPGRGSMVSRTSDYALEVILSVPDVKAPYKAEIQLTAAHKQQVVEAIERYTGLVVRSAVRQLIETSTLKLELGAGTLHATLPRQTCREWFGALAYDKWITKKQKEPASEDGNGGGGVVGSDTGQVTDLSPDELAFVQRWLEANIKRGGDAAGPTLVPTRHLLEIVQRVEQHEHRARIIKLLTTSSKKAKQAPATGLGTTVLEAAIQQAQFEAERASYGFAELKPGDERAATFEQPISFKIDQRSGLVLSGERVPFRVDIDWPPAYTAEQASDLTWRNYAAEIDWVFERELPQGGRKQDRRHVVTKGGSEGISYTFKLEPGEQSAVWTVHAFLRHSHFQPAHETTQVEVKTEQKRLEELRTKSFSGLGEPGVADAGFNFDTSAYNETFGDDKYDKGILFRGDLPADFAQRTTAERLKGLDSSIRQQEQLLAYLQKDARHAQAITAAEHQLAKLRDARKTVEADDGDGWRPFEVRGFFLGRGNHVMDGELEILGAVHHTTIGTTKLVRVQLRDLSRRLTADNYRFEGIGDNFQLAFERAFVDLCKKYPAGRVSVLGEERTRDGNASTGKSVGFELDTGTEWEDTKSVVFDPIVSAVVNIGSAIVMIFAPYTIPVLLPATIAYNATQTVDEMVDTWTSGNLTLGKAGLSLSQIALDILPLVSRARVIQSSTRAFVLIEGFELAGQAVVMTLQAQQQVTALRDQDVGQMAELYAQMVELEGSTHASDPRLATMRAEFDKKAEAIRRRTQEVWGQLIKDQLISLVPMKAAMHLNRHVGEVKLKRLDEQGVIEHRDNVAPYYDTRRGKIVGDQRHMDLAMLDRLTGEQDAHMRALARELADELGVDASKVNLKPDAQAAIWRDGDRIEARYTPGTDPVQTLAMWARLAKATKLADPKAAAKASSRKRRRDDHVDDEDTSESDRPDADAVYDRPLELMDHGDAGARETTARAVPGSAFRGQRTERQASEVLQDLRSSIDGARAHVRDIASLEAVDAGHIRNDDDRARAEQTFLVRLANGEAFTVRIATGPLPTDVVARTILNPTKKGRERVDGVAVAVHGRFVIQVSDTVDPAHYERALAHELAEIVAERQLARDSRVVNKDALAPDAVSTELSPHDRGRLAELEVLATQHGPQADRELLALVEHLGLRQRTETSVVVRRNLAKNALDASTWARIEALSRPDAALDPTTRSALDEVRTSARTHAEEAAARAAYARPLHDLPDAGEGRVTAEGQAQLTRAKQLANEARIRRENKSAETLAKLRALAAAAKRDGRDYHEIDAPQLGAGAALAAREPGRLLVDARGRWQVDGSEYIAQTADQLRGLIDAGIGDPYQFADRNNRV